MKRSNVMLKALFFFRKGKKMLNKHRWFTLLSGLRLRFKWILLNSGISILQKTEKVSEHVLLKVKKVSMHVLILKKKVIEHVVLKYKKVSLHVLIIKKKVSAHVVLKHKKVSLHVLI